MLRVDYNFIDVEYRYGLSQVGFRFGTSLLLCNFSGYVIGKFHYLPFYVLVLVIGWPQIITIQDSLVRVQI